MNIIEALEIEKKNLLLSFHIYRDSGTAKKTPREKSPFSKCPSKVNDPTNALLAEISDMLSAPL